MNFIEQAVVSNKINKLLQGDTIEINGGMRVFLGMQGDELKLAYIAFHETKQEEIALPFDVDFSTFIKMLSQ